MDEETIAEISAALSGSDDEGVWLENVAAVAAFLAVASQWRTAWVFGQDGARMHFVGLDYAGARAGLEAAGIALTPDLWAGVRVMEEAARQAMNGEVFL